MTFNSNAQISGNQYGIEIYDKKNKTFSFVPLGNAAFIEEIFESIETDDIELKLSFEYRDDTKFVTIPRSLIFNKNKLDELTDKGVDVTAKNFNTFVDTIRQQEQDTTLYSFPLTYTYGHLGWIQLPRYDSQGHIEGFDLCYRSNELVGDHVAKYVGDFIVEPQGSFEKWAEVVNAEVVGHDAAELVLLSSLTAIVVGVLAIKLCIENPIAHFYHLSGHGKTTFAMVAASVFGQPFSGIKKVYDQDTSAYIEKRSLLQSWASTTNAMVTNQAGNRGVATILDELGKFTGKNPKDLIYNFSEGSDKMRLSSKMKAHISEGYNTVFLSFGETSLLEKCSDKLEGLNVRVLEINEPLTRTAEQSRKLKDVVTKNNGWAAPKLAQYIIENGGVDYVAEVYTRWIDTLTAEFPESPSGERFIEKFYALFLTTAELARQALQIDFNIESLIEFFKQHEADTAKKRNSSAQSYDMLIEYFNTNINNFYRDKTPPKGSVWGKISYRKRLAKNGRTIITEYAVRKMVVQTFLKENGFSNLDSCIDAWKQAGVIEYDNDRPTRGRVIEPNQKQEDVYVFVVFDDSIDDIPEKIKLTKENK